MQRWDYMVIRRVRDVEGYSTSGPNLVSDWYWSDDETRTLTVEERLKQLGQQGWELVSTYPEGPKDWDDMTNSITYVFKRPIA